MATIPGYNIAFTIDGKACVGETSSNLDISATVKESLTKADKGNKRREVTGHDVTFSINGVMMLNEDGSTASLDADALINLALTVGEASVVPFVYTRGEGKGYKGDMIITSYSEAADAEGNATYTLNCSVSGALTQVA